MWFNPLEMIKTELPPVATFATFASFETETVKSSKSSRSSNGVSIENLTPENLKVAEVAKVAAHTDTLLITCGECLHFKSHNLHGNGAGLCLVGVQSNGTVWWSETKHECAKFDAAIEWVELSEPKPGAIMVMCYKPSGAAMDVEARDMAHANWLKKTNPKRTA